MLVAVLGTAAVAEAVVPAVLILWLCWRCGSVCCGGDDDVVVMIAVVAMKFLLLLS